MTTFLVVLLSLAAQDTLFYIFVNTFVKKSYRALFTGLDIDLLILRRDGK
jgi:hypothetical protein